MRVTPVNTANTEYNCNNNSKPKTQSFKGALLDAAMKEYSAPNNVTEWRKIWNRFAWAVKKESDLKILNKKMFNELMELTGGNSQDSFSFFFKYNLENKPDGTNIPIAADANGVILSEEKSPYGQYLKYQSSDGKVKRLGYTFPIEHEIFRLYVDEYNYIDYYDTTGNPRKMQVGLSGPVYCNEDGKPETTSILGTLFKGLKMIFKY